MADSATVVGVLRVLLSANTAEFDAAMAKSSRAVRAWSRDMNTIAQGATHIGSALTAAITVPLVGLAGASAKAAIDFESSFAGVRKTVDATEAEFAGMAQAFRNLAKEIPINVNELNRLGEAAGAMGIPKAAIVEFSKTMALLGVTTNVTADQAAESIGKIQNIFGAAGVDTDRFASTLVALGNAGASTESDILEMAKRIAGAGNTIGMTQGEVLGFANALSSVGIEAEAGGTAISRVFVDMAAAVSGGGEELEQFARVAGTTAQAFAERFKTDAAGAALSFVEGLQRIKASGGDVLKTLADMDIKEVRLRDTLLRLSGAGDVLRKSLELQGKAWNDNTALTEEARKRFETTAAQMTLLWNRVKDLGITFGNALKPAIDATITGLDGMLPAIDAVLKVFGMLPGHVQIAGLAFAGLLAAAGPVLIIFGQITSALSTALPLLTKWTGAADGAALATKAWGAALTGGLVLAALEATIQLSNLEKATHGVWTKIEENKVGWADWSDVVLNAVGRGLGAPLVMIRDFTKATEDLSFALRTMLGLAGSVDLKEPKRPDAPKPNIGAPLVAPGIPKDLAQIEAALAKTGEAARGARGDLEALRAEVSGLGDRFADFQTKAASGAFSVKQLSKEFGISQESIKLYQRELKGATKEHGEAEKAADKQREALNKLHEELRSAGVLTTQGYTTALAEVTEKLNIAARDGVPTLAGALKALGPTFAKLREDVKNSGQDVAALNQILDGFLDKAGLSKLAADTIAWERANVGAAGSLGGILAVLPRVSVAAEEHALATQITTDAYAEFGLKAPADLRKAADAAVFYYNQLKASGTATTEQLTIAHEKMVEAVNAAAGRIPSVWEKEILPRITSAMDQLTQNISRGFAAMLTGAASFKEGFVSIWDSIKSAVLDILASILDTFINSFLKGLLGAVMGQQGAFGKAFAGLFGGGVQGLLGGLVGGGGAAGAGAALPAVAEGGTFGGLVGGGGTAGGGLVGGAVPWWQTGLGGGLAGGAIGGSVGFGVGRSTGSVAGGVGAGSAAGGGAGFAFGGPIGGLIGLGVGGILGAIGAQRARKEANDLRDQFFEEYAQHFGEGLISGTGSGTTFQRLAAELTEATGEASGGQLFANLLKANDADELAQAISAINEELATYRERTGEATAADAAHTAALTEKTDAIREQMDALDAELAKIDAAEAPEAHMGTRERQARERIAQQKADLEAQLADLQTQAAATGEAIGTGLADGLRGAPMQALNDLAAGFQETLPAGASAGVEAAKAAFDGLPVATQETVAAWAGQLREALASGSADGIAAAIAAAQQLPASVRPVIEALGVDFRSVFASVGETGGAAAADLLEKWSFFTLEGGRGLERLRTPFESIRSAGTAAIDAIGDEFLGLGPISEDAATRARAALASIGRNIAPIDIKYRFRQEGGDLPEGGDIPGHALGGVFAQPHLAAIAEAGEPEIIGSVGFMTTALEGAIRRLSAVGTAPFLPIPQLSAPVARPMSAEVFRERPAEPTEVNVNFTVQAWDGKDTTRVLMNPETQQAVARAYQSAIRRGGELLDNHRQFTQK